MGFTIYLRKKGNFNAKEILKLNSLSYSMDLAVEDGYSEFWFGSISGHTFCYSIPHDLLKRHNWNKAEENFKYLSVEEVREFVKKWEKITPEFVKKVREKTLANKLLGFSKNEKELDMLLDEMCFKTRNYVFPIFQAAAEFGLEVGYYY
jgi:hypothetical protein